MRMKIMLLTKASRSRSPASKVKVLPNPWVKLCSDQGKVFMKFGVAVGVGTTNEALREILHLE